MTEQTKPSYMCMDCVHYERAFNEGLTQLNCYQNKPWHRACSSFSKVIQAAQGVPIAYQTNEEELPF